MPSQRIRRRVERCGPTVRVAFACADVAAEAVSRTFRQEIEEDRDPGSVRSATRGIGMMFRLIGRGIVRRCARMLAADLAYDGARAELRARRQRRDRLAGWLYDHLVDLRRRFG